MNKEEVRGLRCYVRQEARSLLWRKLSRAWPPLAGVV